MGSFARGTREKFFSNKNANDKNKQQRVTNQSYVDDLLRAVDQRMGAGDIDATSGQEAKDLLGVKAGATSVDYNTGITNYYKAEDYLKKAVEGIDPKFRARRQTELLYKTMIDQPGRKQFVFGAGSTSKRSGSTGLLGA